MNFINSYIYILRNTNLSDFGFWSWFFIAIAVLLTVYSIWIFKYDKIYSSIDAETHPMAFMRILFRISPYFFFIIKITISLFIIYLVLVYHVAFKPLNQAFSTLTIDLSFKKLHKDMDDQPIQGIYKFEKPRDILIDEYKKNNKIDSLDTLESSILLPFNNLLNMSDEWYNFYSKDSVELIVKMPPEKAMRKENLYYDVNSLKKELIIDESLYSFDILTKDSIKLYRNGFQYSLNRYKSNKSN